jgi:hypothetical protein
MSSYLHLDLGEQAFERRRQVDGDALQVLAPEARPRNPALPGRPGAVLVVAVLVASKNGLRRRRRELEMQLPSNSCCFADWFGHEEELPQITVVHLAQDFNQDVLRQRFEEADGVVHVEPDAALLAQGADGRVRAPGARSRRDGDPLPPEDPCAAPAVREAQARGKGPLPRVALSNCHFSPFAC